MLIVETEQAKQSQWDGVWCGVNDEDNNNKKKNKGKKEDDDGGGKRFCVSVFVGWGQQQQQSTNRTLPKINWCHCEQHIQICIHDCLSPSNTQFRLSHSYIFPNQESSAQG